MALGKIYNFVKQASSIRYRPKNGKPRSTITNLRQYSPTKRLVKAALEDDTKRKIGVAGAAGGAGISTHLATRNLPKRLLNRGEAKADAEFNRSTKLIDEIANREQGAIARMPTRTAAQRAALQAARNERWSAIERANTLSRLVHHSSMDKSQRLYGKLSLLQPLLPILAAAGAGTAVYHGFKGRKGKRS
jgi:hypothetical protein